jgi:hypothetical protein
MIHLDGEPLEIWIDPDSPEKRGMRRIVWLDSFVKDRT